jgi:hypothetical protein
MENLTEDFIDQLNSEVRSAVMDQGSSGFLVRTAQ